MNVDTSVVSRFSRAAGTYGLGASLHESVADELLARLPWPGPAAVGTIVEIGCGTGVLTTRLRRAYPRTHLTALDVAEGMVLSVAARMAGDRNFVAVRADARAYAAGPFDLAASSSALHWMMPFEETAARLKRLVRPGGLLRAALMVEGTLGELHATRRRLFPAIPTASRLPRADAVLSGLEGAGWRLEAAHEQGFRPTYASAAEFLRVIHAQGLTGGGVSHGSRLLTRGELVRLTEAYSEAYREPDGGVWATYNVLFVAAAR
jgi:malonyl-CoA O-methyltransferase